ncbi:MAG TPA: hypothetical protein IAC74_06225, partial [Candidatus Aphodoplasma excrementigallinarum]|nr:hypothetical protein [Candidatus Aphodoplasma excrementigallinarum]
MKKLTTIIMLLFICIQLTPAHAALEFTVEPISSNDTPNMSSNDLPYVYTLNGIAYLWQGSATLAESIEYTPEIYDSFIDNRSYEYVWTGEYYIGRYKGLDNAPSQYREPPIYQPGLYPVKLYDSELNPIKKHIFQSYVYGIGYFNGEYYCQMGYSSGWVKSSDFETWERTDGSLPRKVGDVITMGGKVSLDGTTLNSVVHENMDSVVLGCNWGKWKFYLNATDHKSLMLTNDN